MTLDALYQEYQRERLRPLLERVHTFRQEMYDHLVRVHQYMPLASRDDRSEPLMFSLMGRSARTDFPSMYNGLIQTWNDELKELEGALHDANALQCAEFASRLIFSPKKISQASVPATETIPDVMARYQMLFHYVSGCYENGSMSIIGTPVQDSILEVLINRRCTFLQKCKEVSYDKIGRATQNEFNEYAAGMKPLFDFNIEDKVQEYVHLLEDLRLAVLPFVDSMELRSSFRRPIPSVQGFQPMMEKETRSELDRAVIKDRKEKQELKQLIFSQEDWQDIGRVISEFYDKRVDFDDATRFVISANPITGIQLVPQPGNKKVNLTELIGYDEEKEALIYNTELLISDDEKDEPNNVFITGPKGTGKSSMVNALLTEYQSRGLKVIDIPAGAIPYLPAVFQQIESHPEYKFMIVVDEFRLNDNAMLFDAMKTVMEGSFQGLPRNARLYVISNNAECMQMGFGKKEEIDLALEDRFGCIVKFHLPDEEEQKEILKSYMKLRTIEESVDTVWEPYQSYLKSRKITQPNPRNIENFVKTLKRPKTAGQTPVTHTGGIGFILEGFSHR